MDRGTGPSATGTSAAGAAVADGVAAPSFGPPFDSPVPPGGYLWWYIDALSDDERFAATLIAFIGSVFSPYYVWAGHRDPLDHCALNVALYGKPYGRWTMTERGRGAVERSAGTLSIGPSTLAWRDGALEIAIDERAAPIPRPVRGTIRVVPELLPSRSFALDGAGRHVWQPIAPRARIAVDLERPALRWTGTAYLDGNAGAEPIAAGFRDWTWSRAHLGAGRAAVLYDAQRRDGTAASLALLFKPDGTVERRAPPPKVTLPKTGWRLARSTRADAGSFATVRRTLEDTPFYARTLVDSCWYGEATTTMHESLSLDRLDTRLVRLMLPFRMPRSFR